MNLRRLVFLVPLVALSFSAHVLSGHTVQASADEDFEQVVEELIDAVSAPRDVDAVADLVADDVIVTDIGRDSFAVVGEKAFVGILAFEDEEGFEENVTFLDLDIDGMTATGKIETRGTAADEAGVNRYRQFFAITFNDDALISRIDLTYDEADAQTREFLNFQEDSEGGGGEPPEGTIELLLAAQPGGSQPGVAYIFPGDAPGSSIVVIVIEGGAQDVLQPAHFHTGSCAAPGPVVYPLASVLNGDSFTALSASPAEIAAQGLILNVHKSVAEVTQYVSCGALGGAEASPTVAPAATATATPRSGIVAPDTGSGPSGAGASVSGTLVALLATGSAVLTMAGARRLRKR